MDNVLSTVNSSLKMSSNIESESSEMQLINESNPIQVFDRVSTIEKDVMMFLNRVFRDMSDDIFELYNIN